MNRCDLLSMSSPNVKKKNKAMNHDRPAAAGCKSGKKNPKNAVLRIESDVDELISSKFKHLLPWRCSIVAR